ARPLEELEDEVGPPEDLARAERRDDVPVAQPERLEVAGPRPPVLQHLHGDEPRLRAARRLVLGRLEARLEDDPESAPADPHDDAQPLARQRRPQRRLVHGFNYIPVLAPAGSSKHDRPAPGLAAP